MTPHEFWNDYQTRTQSTAIYPGQGSITGLSYVGLKLCGETGEVLEHLGKSLRDDGGTFTADRVLLLSKEIGDVLWYMARMVGEFSLAFSHLFDSAPDTDALLEVPGRGTSTASTCYGFLLAHASGQIAGRMLRLFTTRGGSYDSEDRDFILSRVTVMFHGLNRLAVEAGLDLQVIAEENLAKLERRKSTGNLHGSGSDR